MQQNQWTVLKLLEVTRQYFAEKGIGSARLDAELLLAHCLGVSRVKLYLDYDRPLLDGEMAAYRELVQRRGLREPVAYITGTRDFWTLSLEIAPGVLIPRPETEVLVERALAALGTMEGDLLRVLDIGTGSGAISLALATEKKQVQITAIDGSSAAVACARENAERYGLAERVNVMQAKFPADFSGQGPYELIVSNPPYIPVGDITGLAADIKDYEPHEALCGGPDGLDAYRSWIPRFVPLLAAHGRVLLEIGHDQAGAVSDMFMATGQFDSIEVVKDYARHDRVVMVRKK